MAERSGNENDLAEEMALPTNIYILNDDNEFTLNPTALKEFIAHSADHYKGRNMTFTPQMILWHNEMRYLKEKQEFRVKKEKWKEAKEKEKQLTKKATEKCLSVYEFMAKKDELMGTGSRCVRKEGDSYRYTQPGMAARILYNKNGLACLLGMPGEGKSTTAKFITIPTEEENTRRRLARDPIFRDRPRSPAPNFYQMEYVHSPEDFRLSLHQGSCQVFIIEDPFGVHSMNVSMLESWLDTLGEIILQAKASDDRTRLIITCGTHVYEEVKNYLKGREMLPPTQTVDMGYPPVGFPARERLTLLMNQLNCYNYAEAAEKVLPCGRYESFPLACRVLLTFEHKQNDPGFFADPFANFEEEVEKVLAMDKIVYAVLVWVAVRDSSLYLIDVKLQSLPKEDLEQFQTIIEALQIKAEGKKYFVDLDEADMIALRGAAEILRGTFLQPLIMDSYKMVHHRYREYVLRHFARRHLSTLVKLVSKDTFLEMFTTAGIVLSPYHRLVIVPPHQFDVLSDRLIQQVVAGDVRLAVSHRVLSDPSFTASFVSYMQKRNKLIEVCSKEDGGGKPLLFWASWYGHDTFAHSIITREDVLKVSKDILDSVYVLACYKGCIETLKALLGKGYSATELPSVPMESVEKLLGFEAFHDLTTSTKPIHLACLSNISQAVQVLFDHGASATVPNKHGETPLHLVAGRGNAQLLKLLLSKDASVKAATPSGRVPLQDAITSGSTAVASLLIGSGADPKGKRDDGTSLINSAISCADFDMVKLLVEKSGERSHTYMRVWYPLSQALYLGDVRVADYLVEKKMKDYYRSIFGSTPLIWALQERDEDMADFLLEQGMFLHSSAEDGSRPIHEAANTSMVRQIRHLLKMGADLLSKNKKDETPLETCRRIRPILSEPEHGYAVELLHKETEKQRKEQREREQEQTRNSNSVQMLFSRQFGIPQPLMRAMFERP